MQAIRSFIKRLMTVRNIDELVLDERAIYSRWLPNWIKQPIRNFFLFQPHDPYNFSQVQPANVRNPYTGQLYRTPSPGSAAIQNLPSMPRTDSTDKLFDLQTYTDRTNYMFEIDAPRDDKGKVIGPNTSASSAAIPADMAVYDKSGLRSFQGATWGEMFKVMEAKNSIYKDPHWPTESWRLEFMRDPMKEKVWMEEWDEKSKKYGFKYRPLTPQLPRLPVGDEPLW